MSDKRKEISVQLEVAPSSPIQPSARYWPFIAEMPDLISTAVTHPKIRHLSAAIGVKTFTSTVVDTHF